MRKLLIVMGFAVLFAGLTPVGAQAQTFITPFAGVTFGGDAPDEKLSTGASVLFFGKAVGFELELGYTPDFFGENSDIVLIADSNVTTVTGNLAVGVGAGPVRPYVVGGLGVMRARIDADDLFDDLDTNDWAMSGGGGVIGLVSDHVGLRGDVRYFRRLQDPSDDNDLDIEIGRFGFWRAYGGVTFKF